jgi:hypothetical protein
MTEESLNNSLIINHKKGVPVYESNPSIPNTDTIKKRKSVRLGNEQKGFVVDSGGEVLGQGAAAFYEFEEVDNTRFVKLFLAGMKQAAGLSKTGLLVFEFVYQEVRIKPNTDKVELNFYTVSKKITGLTERTYQRGLRELLDREFLFKSPSDGVFFVNIRYIFNGDRLAFVKGYKCKGEGQRNQLVAPENLPSID